MKLKWVLFSNVLTLMLTTSYLTLGLAAPAKAESLWYPYAIIVFICAAINLYQYWNYVYGRSRI